MVGSTAAVALGGFFNWNGKPGSGLLFVACVLATSLFVKELNWPWGPKDQAHAGQARRNASPLESVPGPYLVGRGDRVMTEYTQKLPP
jgi:hypothetical protein